ncbi:MAG: MYXO-CTERM domain-containing protein [Myxococcota bacterium]|jgi:MYXO-CTERM domain-containing protein
MTRFAPLLVLAIPALALASPPTFGGLEGGEGIESSEDQRLDAPTEPNDARIINGEAATSSEFPETGMLLFDGELDFGGFGGGPTRTPVCSSTLIAPDVILLAAHCIDPAALTFGIGEVNNATWYWSRSADLSGLADPSGAIQPLPQDALVASDVVMHPDWVIEALGLGLGENKDIALMFLAEPVLDVDYAYLATPDEIGQITLDTNVTIVGWGQQTATDPFAAPPAGTIYIKQQAVSHISEMADYEFKVGELETDARKCHGDSGGPSFLEMEDQDQPFTRRLIGVTSHAYDDTDCFETGGVDTRVDFYAGWIDEEMRSRCEDGSRAWCGEGPEDYGVLLPPSFSDLEGKKFLGCSCSTGSTPAGLTFWGFGLAALIGLRRRK